MFSSIFILDALFGFEVDVIYEILIYFFLDKKIFLIVLDVLLILFLKNNVIVSGFW
jgi:hypothetical protein